MTSPWGTALRLFPAAVPADGFSEGLFWRQLQLLFMQMVEQVRDVDRLDSAEFDALDIGDSGNAPVFAVHVAALAAHRLVESWLRRRLIIDRVDFCCLVVHRRVDRCGHGLADFVNRARASSRLRAFAASATMPLLISLDRAMDSSNASGSGMGIPSACSKWLR